MSQEHEKTPEVRIQELEKQVETLITRVNGLDIHLGYLNTVTRNLSNYQSENGKYLFNHNNTLKKVVNVLSELKELDVPNWILCPTCGNQIERGYNCCPYCGRDPRTGERLKSVEEYLEDSSGDKSSESNLELISND